MKFLHIYLGLLFLVAVSSKISASTTPIEIKLACDDGVFIPTLTESLGYYAQEGITIKPESIEKLEKEDYLLQNPLIQHKVDAVYHWFQHTIFGARHGMQVKAVMLFNDAPGITVFVANSSKDKVHSASDFKNLLIVLTRYLTLKAGLSDGSYNSILKESTGRQEAVLSALKNNRVDIMTFQEPLSSALKVTGRVSVLYDFNSRETTTQTLGACFPSQCLIMAPDFITSNPDKVQRLVNAYVRTMRFINSHTADEIIAKLPDSYFSDKNKSDEIKLIKATLKTYAVNEYSIPDSGAKLVLDVINSSHFDESVEGKWRNDRTVNFSDYKSCYTNTFVEQAMQNIK